MAGKKHVFCFSPAENMFRVIRTRHTENSSETAISTSEQWKIERHDFTMALSMRKIPVSRNMFFVFRAAHTAGKTGRKTKNIPKTYRKHVFCLPCAPAFTAFVIEYLYIRSCKIYIFPFQIITVLETFSKLLTILYIIYKYTLFINETILFYFLNFCN